jgi:hypothetical protein
MEQVVVGVVVAVVVGTLLWFARPLLNRIEPRRMVLTGDHGVTVRVYTEPADMRGIPPTQILDLEPAVLADSDYYFTNGIPSDGPDDREEWEEWVKHRAGVHAGWQHILVRIQSRQDRSVLLLHPRVTSASTPVDSTQGRVLGPEREAGGNGLLCRQFEVDLDAQQVTYYPGINAPDGETSQFPLTRDRPEAFVLIAHAERGRHEWRLEIDCLVDGETVTLRVDNDGRPFVTVGLDGLERLWWHFQERRWEPAAW